MSNKTIRLLALKLGLGDEENVIRKALEYDRLLQSKSVAGSNLTDTAKLVICLDLAAGSYNVGLDLKTSMKYAGMKSPSYKNCRKTIENLLELNNGQLTTKALTLLLNCGGLQNLADHILIQYSEQLKVNIDLNMPHYVCMAVYQACRLNKVTVQKSKLIEKSRLKKTQWSKLEDVWTQFVDNNFTAVPKGKNKSNVTKSLGESFTEENDKQTDNKCNITKQTRQTIMETDNEAYETWKRRMLEEAYRELKEIELKERMDNVKITSPRRSSPRKTPNSLAPYGASSRQGVRNLFL